jgi:hypothetical protein
MTGIEGWRLGGHDHEVSILITGVGGVGWSRLKTSAMPAVLAQLQFSGKQPVSSRAGNRCPDT